MSKMSQVHMMVSEYLADGYDEEEIANLIAREFDIDWDFAWNLVDEIADEIDKYS